MDNYDTLFDSDLAEHEYIMSQPIKSTKTCAECAYYIATMWSATFADSLTRPHGGADAQRYRMGIGASFTRGGQHDIP